MECNCCGKDSEDNFQAVNPFFTDVEFDEESGDENPVYWWCADCYQESADSI